jgi:hypothetical protein
MKCEMKYTITTIEEPHKDKEGRSFNKLNVLESMDPVTCYLCKRLITQGENLWFCNLKRKFFCMECEKLHGERAVTVGRKEMHSDSYLEYR